MISFVVFLLGGWGVYRWVGLDCGFGYLVLMLVLCLDISEMQPREGTVRLVSDRRGINYD